MLSELPEIGACQPAKFAYISVFPYRKVQQASAGIGRHRSRKKAKDMCEAFAVSSEKYSLEKAHSTNRAHEAIEPGSPASCLASAQHSQRDRKANGLAMKLAGNKSHKGRYTEDQVSRSIFWGGAKSERLTMIETKKILDKSKIANIIKTSVQRI